MPLICDPKLCEKANLVEHLLHSLGLLPDHQTTSMMAHAAVRAIEELESSWKAIFTSRGFLGLAMDVPKG